MGNTVSCMRIERAIEWWAVQGWHAPRAPMRALTLEKMTFWTYFGLNAIFGWLSDGAGAGFKHHLLAREMYRLSWKNCEKVIDQKQGGTNRWRKWYLFITYLITRVLLHNLVRFGLTIENGIVGNNIQLCPISNHRFCMTSNNILTNRYKCFKPLQST